MLRTCALCCAVAMAAVVVGCDTKSSSVVKVPSRDDLAKDYKTKLDDLDKKVADLKAKAEQARSAHINRLAKPGLRRGTVYSSGSESSCPGCCP